MNRRRSGYEIPRGAPRGSTGFRKFGTSNRHVLAPVREVVRTGAEDADL